MNSFKTIFSKTDCPTGELVVTKPSSGYNCSFGILSVTGQPTQVIGLTNVDSLHVKYDVGEVPTEGRHVISTIYN